jgi:hypothetical protein
LDHSLTGGNESAHRHFTLCAFEIFLRIVEKHARSPARVRTFVSIMRRPSSLRRSISRYQFGRLFEPVTGGGYGRPLLWLGHVRPTAEVLDKSPIGLMAYPRQACGGKE